MSEESPAMRFTREQLLRRGLLAGAAVGVAPAFLGSLGAGTASAESLYLDAAVAPAAGTINFFSWQGYDLLDVPVLKSWRKKNHVTIHPTYVSTHNDITAKFTTGGGKGIYDLSTYEAGWGPLYIDLGIPSPIDLSRIPNFKYAHPLFRTGAVARKWWTVDGKQWALPFTWGIQGINYDASKLKAPTSYRDLLSPKLKGKIGITDDSIAAIRIGAHATGIFRIDALYTKSQLNKIIAFWQGLRKNARLIVPSYGNMADLFNAGEIVAATPGWAAVNSFAAAKGKKTVKHVAPKEGSATFCDAFMIPSGAKDLDAVYAYINEAFAPKAQAQEAEFLVQAAVAPKAVPLMTRQTRALYPYGDIAKVLTKSAPLSGVPVKAKVPKGYTTVDDWNAAWQRFKAG
jgi:spermidine/putrescine transport system substrate-binding protein